MSLWWQFHGTKHMDGRISGRPHADWLWSWLAGRLWLWDTYGAPVGYLHDTCGTPTGHIWSALMEYRWGIYRAPIELTLAHLWSSYGQPDMRHLLGTYEARIRHLWDTCGAPTGNLWGPTGHVTWTPMGHLWSSYGALMEFTMGHYGAEDSPWDSYGAAIGPYGAPMGHLWGTYWTPMGPYHDAPESSIFQIAHKD